MTNVEGGIKFWHRLLANLVKFYEGGLDYCTAKRLSFYELNMLNSEANRINKEIERSLAKARR